MAGEEKDDKTFCCPIVCPVPCGGTNAPICTWSHKDLQDVSRRVSFHGFLLPIMYFLEHRMGHGLEHYSLGMS